MKETPEIAGALAAPGEDADVWTFDTLAVFTFRVRTKPGAGEQEALRAARALLEMQVEADPQQGPETAYGMPDDCYVPVIVATRGVPALAYATAHDGSEIPVEEDGLPLPLDGSHRDQLAGLAADWREATDRAALHAAGSALADAVEELLRRRLDEIPELLP